MKTITRWLHRTLPALAALPSITFAAGNPSNLELWVQMNATLEITVTSSTAYDYGAVTAGTTTVSATTFDIKNTGSGLTQTYQLSAGNSGNWTLAGAPGPDTFSVDAQFSFPSPPVSWTSAHRLTGSYAAADATQFAGNETGAGTATNSVRHLWTRFSAPTTSSSATRQRIQLSVNAVAP